MTEGIIRMGDEITSSSSSSNKIIIKSSDNISSDGKILQHVQISESYNDRMSVVEDQFTRVVELGDWDIETTEYYIENEKWKLPTTSKQIIFTAIGTKPMVLIRYQIFIRISISLQRGEKMIFFDCTIPQAIY